MSRLFDDAQSEYLNIAQAVLAGTPLAMVCWFNADGLGINHSLMSIYDKDTQVDCHVLYLSEYYSDVVAMYAEDSGASCAAITSLSYTADTWQHACGICVSATDKRVLLNGGNKGTNATDVTPANMDSTCIGRFGAVDNHYPSGMIAEAAIYDLSVWPGATPSDKADNFEKILPSLVAGYSPLFFPLGLVAYWPLIRGINDEVGGYNLTAEGTTVSAHPGVIYPSRPKFERSSKRTVSLAGSIAIESGMTGALKVSRKLSGWVAIESEVTGALKVSRKLSGSIAIQSGVSGILTIQKENVRWSGGLFTFQGISYEIVTGETNKKFIYWDPNYTTMFRATNNLQDVLNCDGWIMCIGESGVASPVFARKLIHGGIIQAGTITAEFGQIAALTVGTAEMKNLAVETIKIKDQAVTLMVAAYTAGVIYHNHVTSWREAQTITMTTTGAPVMLVFSVQWSGNGDNGINIRVQRDDSSNIYEANLFSIASLGNPFCAIVVDDSPSAAEHTYDLDMQATPVGVGDPHLSMMHRSLVGKEVKK